MSKVNLTISIDDKDKESFNKLVAEIGINTSSAINMFIKQSIREQRLPLNLSLNEKEKNFIDTEKVSEKIMDKYDFAFKELAK
ncbi:type II toxin-antitoxin system RelB/DinJ family antitoxin [Peptoniphilus sp. SGI.035]|uniref:type II toxin-antitoxin system RelB/DinJ family antitoxin n=1 Tax=Peptoniphilus sp. SGI.035 TaxID=3420564 RepID=UPI003D04A9F8